MLKDFLEHKILEHVYAILLISVKQVVIFDYAVSDEESFLTPHLILHNQILQPVLHLYIDITLCIFPIPTF